MRGRKDPIALSIEILPFLAFLSNLQQAGLIVASTGFAVMGSDVDQPEFMVYEDSNMSGLPRMDVSALAHRFCGLSRHEDTLVRSQGSFSNKNAGWSLPLDGKTNHTIRSVVG